MKTTHARHNQQSDKWAPLAIVSNGFGKFHLACAAAELEKMGLLSFLITGAYPTPMVKRAMAAKVLRGHRKVDRLFARGEAIEQVRLAPLWSAELLYELARQGTTRSGLNSLTPAAIDLSFRYYGYRAMHFVHRAARNGARLYHYRAGFGHRSVASAKQLGMVTLCDHSIAHPALLGGLVEQNGQLPGPGETPMDRLWASILTDIERADHVLVNSEFVKSTFLHQGWDPARISVLYQGIDDAFLTSVPKRSYRSAPISVRHPIRLLFAGALERRKGAEILMSALSEFESIPWQLTINGSIDPVLRKQHAKILADPRVSLTGTLSRTELAQTMSNADVFLFPSLAEGSARVVFEAMACGCYIITTPNAGSIVQENISGTIIPPGDHLALLRALIAISNNHSSIEAIGRANASLIRSSYTQNQYGKRLLELYTRLLCNT